MPEFDAIVVGSGPNGLAAGITLVLQGWRVLLLEAKATIGGGMRTAELTLPGFHHDICSAIHPLGMGSPFFKSLDLAEFGLEWIQPELPLAHPFDDGTAVALHQSLEETAVQLGEDGDTYQKLFAPLVAGWDKIAREFLGPLSLPRHPLAMTKFGLRAVWPTTTLAKTLFRNEKTRALFAGLAAHSIMPLEWPLTAAFGLMLGVLGHKVGWPLPRGGSQAIADALAGYFTSLGGEIVTNHEVQSLAKLPPARAVLLDVTPRQLLAIAGDALPAGYRRQLQKYRQGPGVFKLDWALSEPIPWLAAACRRAGTVHLGPTLDEMALSERVIWRGEVAERPYTLVTQQSLFDTSRAPNGQHTGWAYCHVPNGSTVDMTAAIEAQIERFAPGFRDTILARHTMTTQDFQRYNPNYIGGDINGGVQNWRQLFTRPVPRWNPYTTPLPNLFICSSATPPGGGVHGMCGYHAAQTAVKNGRF
ncbi:MAG: NAD(P)/FAD-dependent oxidoreductase [Anaerolineales bacterium]|nr:NAD(P)/FAD-dependent oxidoreductase [Anaerolineales bacterium]MCB8936850.1 NAD(P)/FAD-dependent oxidoreductase [Ardenticatenaceae bacterium]